MTPTDIIDALGGTPAVSKALRIPANTVRNWQERRSIPARYHGALLDLGAGKITADEIVAAHTPADIHP